MTQYSNDPMQPLAAPSSNVPANPYVAGASNMWLEEPAEKEGVSLNAVLHSLRRRWLPATLIGMVLATLLAAVLAFLIPVKHEAVGMLKVSYEFNDLMNKSGKRHMDTKIFEVFRDTQISYVRSPFVLNLALRKLDTQNIKIVDEQENPLAFLQDEIRASFPSKGEIMRVTMKGRNDKEVIAIVQAVMEAYLEEIRNNERSDKSRQMQGLKEQYRALVSENKERMRKVQKLAEDLGTSDSDIAKINQQIALDLYRNLQRKQMQIRSDIEDMQKQLYLAQAASRDAKIKPHPFDIEVMLERDPQYMEAKQLVDYLDRELANTPQSRRPGAPANRVSMQRAQYEKIMNDRRRDLTPRIEHALMRELYGEDEAAKSREVSSLQAQLGVTQQIFQQVASEVEAQRQAIQEMSGFSAELETEKSQVESIEDTLQELSAEIQHIDINMKTPPRITMVQPATVPKYDSRILKFVSIAGAWLVALLSTIFGITAIDYFAKRLNEPKDLERAVQLPVVGTLPPVRGRLGVLGNSGNREVMIANSIDSLRAAIAYGGSRTSSIVVTSAVGQEGKSTVASQLAVSLARAGIRTVLVDGDIRRPSLHDLFGIVGDNGLCEVLRSQAELRSVVQATPSENLWVLPAGRCDKASFQAMAGSKLTDAVNGLKQQFEFVVIDAGPVLTGPEALIFGQCVDGAVLSCRRDVSTLPKVDEANRRLRSVGIHVIGSVVNGVTSETRNQLVSV